MTAPQVSRAVDGELMLFKALGLLTTPLQTVLALSLLRPSDPGMVAMVEWVLGAYAYLSPFLVALVVVVVAFGEVAAHRPRRAR